jgi:hypothetical protein
MKITKEKTITETVTIVEDIICNNCGESCKTDSDFNQYDGLIEVCVSGGYFSKFIGDLNSYTFSLCEKCVMEMIKSFKINPLQEFQEP